MLPCCVVTCLYVLQQDYSMTAISLTQTTLQAEPRARVQSNGRSLFRLTLTCNLYFLYTVIIHFSNSCSLMSHNHTSSIPKRKRALLISDLFIYYNLHTRNSREGWQVEGELKGGSYLEVTCTGYFLFPVVIKKVCLILTVELVHNGLWGRQNWNTFKQPPLWVFLHPTRHLVCLTVNCIEQSTHFSKLWDFSIDFSHFTGLQYKFITDIVYFRIFVTLWFVILPNIKFTNNIKKHTNFC